MYNVFGWEVDTVGKWTMLGNKHCREVDTVKT